MLAEGYFFPCGCLVELDAAGKVIKTKRCDEHRKKYPHRLDEEKK